MSKIITFSRQFPTYHPRAGEPTYFVEKFWMSLIEQGEISLSKCCSLSRQTNIGNFDMNNLRKADFTRKYHTIRAGNRFKIGDKFSPRIWGTDINPKSGKSGPYQYKMITISPDIEIKKLFDFEIIDGLIFIEDVIYSLGKDKEGVNLSLNDGLEHADFLAWFKYPKPFKGQIICWNDTINY